MDVCLPILDKTFVGPNTRKEKLHESIEVPMSVKNVALYFHSENHILSLKLNVKGV